MRQINGKVIVAMMVMIIFTMTACKNKKPVVDPVETSAQVEVESITEDGNQQEDSTVGGESTEGADESLMEDTTVAEESTGSVSDVGNKKPSGSTGSQGQSGSVGGNQVGGSSGWKPEEEEAPKYPWDLGGKQPQEYTWEEYLALSPELKDAFLKSFSDARAYERWRDNALKIYNEGGDTTPPDEDWEEPTQEQPKLELPWENGGKQPDQYTWTEYEALTSNQQMAFQNWFDSIDEFETWMKNAQGNGGSEESDQPETPSMPWENGGKLPNQYTWAEYEALTPDQQMAFQNWFASVDEFTAWMQQAQGNGDSDEEYLPWEHGGKQPSEYTWAEFETLTPGQQMAFQNWFGSIDAFDAWMKQAQGTGDSEGEYLPWEHGGKQPSEYTWAEFEALTPGQQMAFQNWFDSIDAFDAWMQQAQGNIIYLPWEDGGKQPSEYTWDEFQNLSPEQQMAFQNWFGSWEEFDKWLTANQP